MKNYIILTDLALKVRALLHTLFASKSLNGYRRFLKNIYINIIQSATVYNSLNIASCIYLVRVLCFSCVYENVCWVHVFVYLTKLLQRVSDFSINTKW